MKFIMKNKCNLAMLNYIMFLVVLGFELRVLPGRCYTTWSFELYPRPFCFIYFSSMFSCLYPGWPIPWSSYSHFPCSCVDSKGTMPRFIVVEVGSLYFLSRLVMNHDSPDFCLLSSWDYNCKTLCPGLKYILIFSETN
jgi:hypothetical protein